jgi:protein-L-isoaspartate(D-aspartate) O-methyltransferase
MRKRVSQPGVSQSAVSWGEPTRARLGRYDASTLAPGVTPANSNTRVSAATLQRPAPRTAPDAAGNMGLNSDRLRAAMVQRLRAQGITDERVLTAMEAVPRHLFVDQALASRAYEDAALPIGHSQTISQPWVVARMIAAVCEGRAPTRVLEVGAGCGYQAAVLAQFIRDIYTIERIRGLYELARGHLRELRLTTRVRLTYGDGMIGLPNAAPFDAIVVAAAGIAIPQALLSQLAPGGRLIAPEGTSNQRLVLVERTGAATWKRVELEAVRFVPLRAGIQS